MAEKNNSVHMAATDGRKLNRTCNDKSIAHLYSTTGKEEMQEDFIFSLLPVGYDNAISTKDLFKTSGFSSLRRMTKEIEAERRNGALILSRCDERGGYFRPSDGAQGVAEVGEYMRQMERRAKSIFYTIKAARKYIKENEVSHDEQ